MILITASSLVTAFLFNKDCVGEQLTNKKAVIDCHLDVHFAGPIDAHGHLLVYQTHENVYVCF